MITKLNHLMMMGERGSFLINRIKCRRRVSGRKGNTFEIYICREREREEGGYNYIGMKRAGRRRRLGG